MITRIFRVRVREDLHAEFEHEFLLISVPYVKSAPGLVSVAVGRPTRWEPDEYAMVSVWQSEADIAAFAGENWNLPIIPQGMEKYASDCRVHHYEMFD